MLAAGYGRIVNLASFHVVATYPERAAYVAAKAGVVGLTQAFGDDVHGALYDPDSDAGGFPMDMVLDYVRVYSQQ